MMQQSRETGSTASLPRAIGGGRHGTVTEFERPAKITFHQPMTMRLHADSLR